MDNNLEKRVTALERLHIWGGAVIGVLVFWYILNKYKK